MHRTDLADLSDDALVSRLSTLCAEGHALTARILVLLIEVEERRLDLRAACTSMYDFCQRRLGMSESAAFRRVAAARVVKRFPALLGRIERGELHLSTLVLLRPHLDDRNVEELAAAVVGKTQRQVEELLARRAPKPAVPSAIVGLVHTSKDAPPALFDREGDRSAPSVPHTPSARIQPLSEARYRVQLTAGDALKAKLERACDLMRHRNPSGDLAIVLDAAMDLLLAKLEKERLGKVNTPRAPATGRPGSSARPATERGRAIPIGVRRAVFERDGEQCTFLDDAVNRCPQRGHLELDHIEARALGGTSVASNLRVRCRAHNRLAAEDVFGKAHSPERIDLRQRRSRAITATRRPSCPPPPPPPAAPSPQVMERAVFGLENMGFSRSDARRAVDLVTHRRGANTEALDVTDLVRGAIAALT